MRGEVVHLQQGLTRLPGDARILVFDAAAHHEADQFILLGIRGQLGDELAVTQHRHGVGDAGNLVEMVGDEHHAHPGGLELVDHLEQLVDLPPGQRCGRLIEDEHACVMDSALAISTIC